MMQNNILTQHNLEKKCECPTQDIDAPLRSVSLHTSAPAGLTELVAVLVVVIVVMMMVVMMTVMVVVMVIIVVVVMVMMTVMEHPRQKHGYRLAKSLVIASVGYFQ